ncbi:MAG: ABC transporter permease [Kangiellaceae bacterium]|nr:ABC transporter permease [Kangiellaceae bacterium]
MFKIYLKELLELTRDKKTLMFTILLPTLLMPIIMIGFGALVAMIDNKAKNEVLEYNLIGAENYPEFSQALLNNSKFSLKSFELGTDYSEAINNDELRFLVTIPDDTQARMNQGQSAIINVLYNDSSTTSAKVISRINTTIDSLRSSQADARLVLLGVSASQRDGLIEPIKLIEATTANERESLGEKIGGFLPYILILLALSGAMYPASDLGVGEKERGTLETLLLTPVPRMHIVLAKFLVIFTTSFLSILFSLVSFALISMVFGPAIFSSAGAEGGEGMTKLLEILSSISVLDVFLMFLMLVPVCAVFGSLLLSVSIYARTFKEAQNYMSPIMMLSIFPVILALLPGVKLDWVWASVPLTNVALAIKEIFKGTIDYSMLGVILGSTTVVAGILLGFCNWWFQREQVLFRN